MKKNILTILFQSIVTLSLAQFTVIDSEKTYGGRGLDTTIFSSKCTDGSFILATDVGFPGGGDLTITPLGMDIWVMKLKPHELSIEWQKSYGGDGTEINPTIVQTADGGFILGASSTSGISGNKTTPNNGHFDYWILKLDSLGNVEWEKNIGGSDRDSFTKIIPIPGSDGYIVGGTSKSPIGFDKTEDSIGGDDYWFIRLDNLGNIVNQNVFGGQGFDQLMDMQLVTGGGYADDQHLVLAGHSNSAPFMSSKTAAAYGGLDFWTHIISLDLDVEEEQSFGGSNYDFLSSVVCSADGGFIFGGHSNSDAHSVGLKSEDNKGPLNTTDFYIVKTNDSLKIEWNRTIGGSMTDICYSVAATPDGGCLAGGASNSPISSDKTENPIVGGIGDWWFARLNNAGDVIYDKTFGSLRYEHIETMWHIKGADASSESFFIGGFQDTPVPNLPNNDKSERGRGSYDFWIAFVVNSDITPIVQENSQKFKVYPNPVSVNENINIEAEEEILNIQLLDSRGKLIHQEMPIKGENTIEIPMKYFLGHEYGYVKVISENNTQTEKILIRH